MTTTDEWQKLAQLRFENKTEANNIDFKRDLTTERVASIAHNAQVPLLRTI